MCKHLCYETNECNYSNRDLEDLPIEDGICQCAEDEDYSKCTASDCVEDDTDYDGDLDDENAEV